MDTCCDVSVDQAHAFSRHSPNTNSDSFRLNTYLGRLAGFSVTGTSNAQPGRRSGNVFGERGEKKSLHVIWISNVKTLSALPVQNLRGRGEVRIVEG